MKNIVRMMNRLLLTVVFLTTVATANAQFDNIERVEMFGVIKIQSDETPIAAKLTLQSLPDGDEVYIVNSDNGSGRYKVNIEKGTSYSLLIEAKGFFRVQQKVMFEDDTELNFYLTPSTIGTALRLNINFKLSSSEIEEDSYPELERVLEMMREYPTMVVQLEGHTDFRGNAKKNQELSEERVESIKNYLVNRNINRNRIKLKAFGGTQPLSRENTEEARSMNRRVEVRILEI
jgi:OmpA-OmpF porin, OOP family